MAKPDLGDKQVCPNCGAKFYDLRRRPAVCPKCTTSFDPSEEGVRVRRGRSRVAAQDADYEDEEELDEKKAGAGEDEDEEVEVEETAEVDAAVEAEPLITDEDDDDAAPAAGDDLPEGFSEDDESDLGDDADDTVPLLEDEEEFPEDELGDLPAEDEDDSGR